MWSIYLYIYTHISAIKIQQLCWVAPEECFKHAYRESIRLWAVFNGLSDISPFMLPCWHVGKIHQAWNKLSIVSVNWSQIKHGMVTLPPPLTVKENIVGYCIPLFFMPIALDQAFTRYHSRKHLHSLKSTWNPYLWPNPMEESSTPDLVVQA